jgi:hypothetical protein
MFINKEKLNMKRKNIILVMLPILMAIFALQSCTKEATTPISIFKAAVPGNPTPAVAGVVPLSGTSYTLKWVGTTATTWDVYVGTSSSPDLAKAGVTGNTYTFTAAAGGHFYWFVETVDANKVRSTSPTWNFYINSGPTTPILTAPAANAVKVSVLGTLTWTATDAEGDALTYDVFLGTTATPGLVAANLTSATYSPAMVANTLYYWKVVVKDSHGATATSAVGSFTTGAEPIMTYTGTYLCDEPAEAYSYDVTFAKASATTVKTVNYWNSGWTGVFTIDVTNKTFSMPLTVWGNYSASEAGVIDPLTGKMTGTYTIFYKGSSIEEGVHTYTKY